MPQSRGYPLRGKRLSQGLYLIQPVEMLGESARGYQRFGKQGVDERKEEQGIRPRANEVVFVGFLRGARPIGVNHNHFAASLP